MSSNKTLTFLLVVSLFYRGVCSELPGPGDKVYVKGLLGEQLPQGVAGDCFFVYAEPSFDFIFRLLRDLFVPVLNNASLPTRICERYIVATGSLEGFRTTVLGLKRWSDHWILGLVREKDALEFKRFLKMETSIFKESQTVVVWLNQKTVYRLSNRNKDFRDFTNYSVWTKKEKRSSAHMNGKTVTLIGSNATIFARFSDSDGGVPRWSKGVEVAMWEEMAKCMNVSWNVKVPNNKGQQKWSFRSENGTLMEGIYNKLLEGEADLGMGCIWITSNKLETVHFSVPISDICQGYLVPRPGHVEPDWRSSLHPFSATVWSLLIFSVISTTLTLWTVSKYSSDSPQMRRSDESRRSMRARRLDDWAATVMGILALVSLPKVRLSGPGWRARHLMNLWSVFSLWTAVAYSSCLVSHLTTPLLTRKADSVRDMVLAGYRWGTRYPLDMATVLDPTDPWHRAWSERFIRFKTQEEHVAKLKGNRLALWGQKIDHRLFLLNEHYFPAKYLTRYEASRQCTSRFYYGFALRRGSPLLGPVNAYLSRFVESGVFQKILTDVGYEFIKDYPYAREVMRYSPAREVSQGPAGKTLGVNNLQGVFYLLGAGLALSALAFLVELSTRPRNVFAYTD